MDLRVPLSGAWEMVGASGGEAPKPAVFGGAHLAKFDEKGRVPIPMPFRDLLGPEPALVTTIYVVDGCRCLEAYPIPVWERFVTDFEAKSDLLANDREHFRSVYVGAAATCQLDRQGRILVPQTLRSLAELQREVQIVGVGSTIRIFDKERYARVVTSLLEKLSHPRGDGFGGISR
jgi:MraZ protein